MAYLNTKATSQQTFDAIVVGSGISGGWAAKELCEKGLKTLLLERGRNVEHVKDYTTAMMHPWEFPHRLNLTEKDRAEDPIQSQGYDESNKHFFVRDHEHPYIQEKPFSWIRGYQVGGRSLTWGRQCYRLSDLDFEANAKDGKGVDWPIRYKDIAPWYDYVESFVGISGQAEGLPQLPDGQFLPPMELNCLEQQVREQLKKLYPDRLLTIARVANLSQGWKGRGPCQYRNLCHRGCPFGGYFSTNAATLPVAMETGNLTLRPFSIVTEVLYDKDTRKAKGVRIIDTETLETTEYYARIIFLNASTIGTAAILLKSVSDAFPNGLGNNNDLVGRNLMDHHIKAGAYGVYRGLNDQYYAGRRPAGFYIPRFRNINEATRRSDFVRGYGFQGHGEREAWIDNFRLPGHGTDFKKELTKPNRWTMWLGGWGEILPYADNRVTLDKTAKDKWGQPLVRIHFEIGENEIAMRKDMKESAAEMLERCGFTEIDAFNFKYVGGECIHEMGTACMGHDPKTSVLNKWNQVHEAQNVFITDGSCMTSSGCQNPSLTYMALTARACDHAVALLKNGEL
ncbi:choline dehydrogenase-like flavoprotein [Chitinophaga terrae (ex Kim and Jung 2007)]|uniref:GMC oxidoreductase n=1 Tax=Chitinophaga terrae (ex Kim and Jung 2007) TaxID=408074 RepID=UPI00277ECBD4|nr:GMC family oxidoreductase [Chitinophaga terrae (ex Kim and Jung 2007)]MDQ0109394.1 choline dehydrogenase-like flavoprotein [Chitinophaga terrae (ex Kim and Jung 2007)]